jgi:hypothetical protein
VATLYEAILIGWLAPSGDARCGYLCAGPSIGAPATGIAVAGIEEVAVQVTDTRTIYLPAEFT